MSEALVFSRKETGGGRLLLLLIIPVVLLLLAQGFFQLIVVPRVLIRRIQVRSELPLRQEEVVSLAGLSGRESYFSIRCEEVKRRLESYPLVRKAEVLKRFPDTLHIVLYGRKPLLAALVEVEGRTVPVAIDEEGVIFAAGQALREWDLPIISGLQFRSLEAGSRLPELLFPLLAELKTLRNSAPQLYRLLSEVKVIQRNSAGLELLVSPLTYPIKIRFSKLDENGIKHAMLVLDVLERQGALERVKELDFRTAEVVYRL